MNNGVAETILAQLGGPRFVLMTGARDLTGSDTTFSCRLGRNAKSVTHLRVTLDPSDTYTVQFLRARLGKFVVVSSFDDIYCDQLCEIVERETGLYLSL